MQLLGADDHSKLGAFYREVDERNRFYPEHVIESFLDTYDERSRREIIETVKRLFDEIAWLSVRKNEVRWPTE